MLFRAAAPVASYIIYLVGPPPQLFYLCWLCYVLLPFPLPLFGGWGLVVKGRVSTAHFEKHWSDALLLRANKAEFKYEQIIFLYKHIF